jgi:hypothetical protein
MMALMLLLLLVLQHMLWQMLSAVNEDVVGV